MRVARLRLGGQAVSEATVEWRSIDCARQLCNLNCIGPLSNDTTLLNNYRHIHRKPIYIRETEDRPLHFVAIGVYHVAGRLIAVTVNSGYTPPPERTTDRN